MKSKFDDWLENAAHEYHDKEFGMYEQDSIYRVCFKFGAKAAHAYDLEVIRDLVKAFEDLRLYHASDYTQRSYLDDRHAMMEIIEPLITKAKQELGGNNE